MDDLLAELEEEIRSAKIEMKSLKKEVKLQMSLVIPVGGETPHQKEVLTFPGPCHSFGKSERFKEPNKNNDESDAFGESYYSEYYQDYILPQAYEAIQQKKPNTIFSKSERFIEPKKDEIQLPIEPNYDFIKKRAPQPTICPKKQSIQTPAQKKLLQSGFTQNDLDEMETQASMSQVGPGAYIINYSVLESGRGVALTKEPRFREIKTIEQLPIQPNYDYIKQKPPLVKISRKTERNKQLQQRDQIRQLEEEDMANQYKRRQLDLHNAIKPHAPQAIIMRDYKEIVAAAVGSKQRRFLIMKLMDELKFKCLGPGAYDIAPQRLAPCAVVYRHHSAESKRLIIDERPSPGPDYYYSKDDLIKTKTIVHAFGNEPRIKKIKKSDLDLRPDLNINIEAIKNKAPAISIAPEQSTYAILPDEDKIIEQRRGPGSYQPLMKIIEARSDKGAVKLQPLNEKNDRANEINLYEKEIHDYDVQLFPTLDAIKPHIQAFTYHEPIEHKPQHIPEANLFPERWDFYDANIQAVKERVGEAVPHFGGKAGRGLIEFLRYQEHLDNFRGYMKRQDYIPEIGQYDIKYVAVDPDRKGVDFSRYQERDIGPIEKHEGDLPGDNLILNPQQLPQHIQNIDFQKYSERPQGPVAREDPELDLNPNINVIKPSIKQVISFEKMLDRPHPPQQQEEELIIEPQFVQVERKVIGVVNFDKQLNRQEDPRFNMKVDDNQLIIEPKIDVIKSKIKGGIKMEKGVVRFQKGNPEKDKIPAPVNISRIEKAEKYMRPNIPKINMKSTSSRGGSIQKKK